MKNSENILTQLLKMAHQKSPSEELPPPPGFATRVAARWVASAPGDSLWARLCLASLPCGALAAGLCLYFAHNIPSPPPDDSHLAQWMVQAQLPP